MKKYLIFPLVAVLFISCGGKSEEEYFESANKLILEGSISEAITEYENMINEFPEGQFVTQALFQIGTLYQNKQIKNLEATESLQKAIEYYEKIYNEYSESVEAPKGLFMIGFIQANELFNLDAAKESYSLFLQKYPDHELAVSAQGELEMLGKTPEEILLENKKNQ
ncbi:MAG: tetratricopeptide repeat protein [Ignavibacteriales bacterium]|nr:tetratricopeptide repeat protein [Ignavibacteriales bacterium]